VVGALGTSQIPSDDELRWVMMLQRIKTEMQEHPEHSLLQQLTAVEATVDHLSRELYRLRNPVIMVRH